MSATTYTPIVKVQSSSAARNALRDVAEFRARHWRAQSVILSSLLAGNAFAIGHHFFYQSLHHVPTDETSKSDVSKKCAMSLTFRSLCPRHQYRYWNRVCFRRQDVLRHFGRYGVLAGLLARCQSRCNISIAHRHAFISSWECSRALPCADFCQISWLICTCCYSMVRLRWT